MSKNSIGYNLEFNNVCNAYHYFRISFFRCFAYLAKDGVYVIDYITSKSNLDNVELLVFGNTADEFSKNIIEICANEDGNYTKVIGANTISSKYIEWKRSKLNIITLSKLIHVIMILKKQLI